jgi:hypothetical protein
VPEWQAIPMNQATLTFQNIPVFRGLHDPEYPYWEPGSRERREYDESQVAERFEDDVVFFPDVKSIRVYGGIGTIHLPPDISGAQVMTASSHANASTGVPILMLPEVIEGHRIRQGDMIAIIDARWQPMAISWANSFDSTLPKGYLVVDKPEMISIEERGYPIVYHPFSIMEYRSDNALLYDFVYKTVMSESKDERRSIQNFFDGYAKKDGRYGSYILNPDIVEPLFDSRYTSPAELRSPSEKAMFSLLLYRVKGRTFEGLSLDDLQSKLLSKYTTATSILRLAGGVSIPVTLIAEGTPVYMAAQVLSICIEYELVGTLINRMKTEYPNILS